jgi:quercetin dioxygenase-like cupin family protein
MPFSHAVRDGTREPPADAGPSLTFDLSRQIKELRRETYWQGGRNSRTLARFDDLRIVLTAIQANTTIHEHRSAGRISLQTIEGHLRMHAGGRAFDLPAGKVIVLDPGVPHDVHAMEDSAFLLTIAWPGGSER